MSSASGDVVFFLDDDDEMLPGYCERVLCPDGPASQAEWGFSSIHERHVGQSADSWRQRQRLTRGPVPRHARTRDALAAMSDGFWIRRTCFQQIGGLDPVQSIDEDTDLCARLLAQSHRPWYEPEPGMVVYKGYAPARPDGAQLTLATPSGKGLQCYRRTYDKNATSFGLYSSMRWFLATRYLRRAVKAGAVSAALSFAMAQRPWPVALSLMAFVGLKRLAHP